MKSMTKQFVQKNIELSLEFDNFLAKHPELYDSIPNGAVVVITLESDKKFSEASIQIVKHYPKKQPIVEARKENSEWVLHPLTLSPA